MDGIFWLLLVLLIIAVLWLLFMYNDQKFVEFNADLRGANKVPPTNSQAHGAALFTYNPSTKSLSYDVFFTGLTPTAAHFHRGSMGVSGPIVKTLTWTSLGNGYYRMNGVWTPTDAQELLTDDLINALKNGDLYINVHTAQYPNGEIRGQLLKT